MRGDRSDRRTRRTRRLIGEALVGLMVERRYSRITVQQIIDRADVGRSTFYAHYRDKEDVLVSESERVLALFHEHLDPAGAGDQELLPSLGLFRHIGERHDIYNALARGHGLTVLYETCHRYLSNRVGQRLAVLAQGAPPTTVPLPILADYVASTFLNLARWWLEEQRPHSPEQMDAIFQQLVLPGIRAGMQPVATDNAPLP